MNYLKKIRLEKNMTQEALAAQSKVGRSTISEIENDHTQDPGVYVAQDLAKTLGVTVSDIFPPELRLAPNEKPVG